MSQGAPDARTEQDHIVAFFTVQNALDHLRSNVDYKNGQAAVEAFSVLARDASNVVEERDNLRRKLESQVQQLEAVREWAKGEVPPGIIQGHYGYGLAQEDVLSILDAEEAQ